MRFSKSVRWFAVSCCVWSMVFPGTVRAGNPAAPMTAPVVIRDLALQPDGSLHGILQNDQGQPQVATDVAVLKGREVVCVCRSRVDGTFVIRDVRPGVYELATAKSGQLYRVWAPRTAPPSAQPSVLLVEGKAVVRGQDWSPWRRALILGGVIATSGVVGGVIGYNIKDDAS